MNNRQQFRKGLILFSFSLFPAVFYYFSPVLIIEATIEGVINGSWIIFLLLFLGALILGRGFCGWLCPAAGCQESIFLANNNRVTRGNIIKWIIWIPWISTIVWLAYLSGGYKSINFFYQTVYGLSISNVQSVITYFCVLLILIVLPAFIIERRSFCHHLCWMAPFMIIGRKIARIGNWPHLKLRANTQECIHCKTCTDHCPMSLPVENMVSAANMENSECILCGTCIDVCQKKVIHYSMTNG